MLQWLSKILLLLFLFIAVNGRIHHLSRQGDKRRWFELTTFGFLKGGSFQVNLNNFTFHLPNSKVSGDDADAFKLVDETKIGFTMSKGDEFSELMANSPQKCLLNSKFDRDIAVVNFVINYSSMKLLVSKRGSAVSSLVICENALHDSSDPLSFKCMNDQLSITYAPTTQTSVKSRPRRAPIGTTASGTATDAPASSGATTTPAPQTEFEFPLERVQGTRVVSTKFSVYFLHPQELDMYSFVFHNCFNYHADYSKRTAVDYSVSMIERNVESYLSAGDLLKPKLYFGLSAMYVCVCLFWLAVIRRSSQLNVYKIHYLMAILVFIKSLSLLFHGVDYYFISKYGHQREVWAVVYYIMHLLKGALLFGVVILIGTGWTFFKNFLTERDKRIFMIIIPLQVLDNIALIIMEETEHGAEHYKFWLQLFIFIDLLCCAAIILPVVWSIRHLTEASETDGKAAFNLGKLKLFRHFYVIVICYIYLTRILKYLVAFTVPYSYTWLVVIVEELGTFGFFMVTGYKFQPTKNNPYLKLDRSDDEEDMDEAITECGLNEGVVRIKRFGDGSSSTKPSSRYDDDGDQQKISLLNDLENQNLED